MKLNPIAVPENYILADESAFDAYYQLCSSPTRDLVESYLLVPYGPEFSDGMGILVMAETIAYGLGRPSKAFPQSNDPDEQDIFPEEIAEFLDEELVTLALGRLREIISSPSSELMQIWQERKEMKLWLKHITTLIEVLENFPENRS